MKKLLALTLLLLIIPSGVKAVTGSDFTIKTAVGSDTTPPSTPTLLSATPIAPTQIDLTWSTSTDNWILGGYVVWRDGLPIATTTLNNYNDTGLTAETVYTYAVHAFDSAFNISSTSNSLTATTTAWPPMATSTPPNPGGQVSGSRVLTLQDLRIEPKTNSATFFFTTNRPTRYILRWGRTDAYTGGYIENDSYKTNQQTTITDLEPGTTYLFELIGYTPAGVAITLRKGQFTTSEEQKNRVVANVERLTATVTGDDVKLDYQLPINEPGAKVRILRSYLGYPTDLFDGAIVYEGNKTSVFDRSALLDYKRQYYTVFVIGSDGTISSGAVIMVNKITGDSDRGQGNEPTATGTPTTEPDIALTLLTLEQIKIIQQDNTQTFLDEAITLSYLDPFTIFIPKEALPDHLKSIIVTLLDPTDQRRSYSFLLKINKDNTAYEAKVGALKVLGSSQLTLEVFDFDQLVVGRYRKQIDFTTQPREEAVVVFPDGVVSILEKVWPFIIVPFLLFILWWWLIGRRKKEAEDKL